MSGGPSQIDLFDPKPALTKWDGQPPPPSLIKDMKLAFLKPSATLMGSPRQFKPYGQCGMEFSDYLPYTSARADDICLIRSMRTDAINHDPGEAADDHREYDSGASHDRVLGDLRPGKRVAGPARLRRAQLRKRPQRGTENWASGFMPSVYQGTPFRSSGDPILYLSNPPGIDRPTQRRASRRPSTLEREALRETGDAEIASRIASYELAFRMQMAAPELLDFSKEKPAVLDAYGVNRTDEQSRAFSVNCLLARRTRGARRAVRHADTCELGLSLHDQQAAEGLLRGHRSARGRADRRPQAAGLLDSTLVIWGGEFGRTPMGEPEIHGGEPGRDHHASCFSMWLAGGGIRGGQVVGKTDELGLHPVEDPVHVHDLQATVLHCVGLKHTDLTYRHMGRDFRLTDVGGRVVTKLLHTQAIPGTGA